MIIYLFRFLRGTLAVSVERFSDFFLLSQNCYDHHPADVTIKIISVPINGFVSDLLLSEHLSAGFKLPGPSA